MKTHYFPWGDEDAERAPCGTWFGETSNVTGDWRLVTCRVCLRRKTRIMRAVEEEERLIVKQMGDMADFMEPGVDYENECEV